MSKIDNLRSRKNKIIPKGNDFRNNPKTVPEMNNIVKILLLYFLRASRDALILFSVMFPAHARKHTKSYEPSALKQF